MKSLMTSTKYCSGDQSEKNEMDGACSACGGRRCLHMVWWGNLREKDHLEDTGVDGRIFRNWDVGTWTGLIWLRIGTGSGHL